MGFKGTVVVVINPCMVRMGSKQSDYKQNPGWVHVYMVCV